MASPWAVLSGSALFCQGNKAAHAFSKSLAEDLTPRLANFMAADVAPFSLLDFIESHLDEDMDEEEHQEDTDEEEHQEDERSCAEVVMEKSDGALTCKRVENY